MADGTLKVGTLTTSSGSGTITVGASGETVDLSNGTMTLNSSMKNTPAWSAKVNSDVTGQSWNSTIVLPCSNELLDTNGAYDTSTYRFTVPSGGAGKYFVSINCNAKSASGAGMRTLIYAIRVNGSNQRAYQMVSGSDFMENNQDQKRTATGLLDLSVADYVDSIIYAYGGSGSLTIKAETFFEGYRIIGA